MRLPSAITLAAFLVFGHEVATATLPQVATQTDTTSTANKPLTGRAIPCEHGRILSFECQNVELLSYLPTETIGKSSGADLWGWHDSTTGREFVIIGGSSSTAFVEVTDPVNPKYLGVLPPHEDVESYTAQSVKVYKHYAFVGYEDGANGIQIFDLTQLRDVQTPPVVFKETTHYSGVASVHTIAVNQETGFVYANGSDTCNGGLHMIDVRTPTKPIFAGCYSNTKVDASVNMGGLRVGGGPGYVHDTQCTIYRGPDRQYTGREICFNSSGTAFVIVDVTDKQQPKTISTASYPDVGYIHQGWLTDDQRYFFLDDESKGSRTSTEVFDLSDLDDPIVLTRYYATTDAVPHNLYIRGRYMYQGNNEAGLRILDIADPKHPKEAGYLSKIGAAWGTYPFFRNNGAAVSTDTGLFLVRLPAR